MKETILKNLNEIEEKYEVKILYAIESGSRAWGFASQDSDYDVRFIYVHKKDWYLDLSPKDDFINYCLDDVLDINGWDLSKTLKLLNDCNPSLSEWLYSPIIYKESDDINELRGLLKKHINEKKEFFHYLSLAKKTYKNTIQGKDKIRLKKYFYILRALLCCEYIYRNHCLPPVKFEELYKGLLTPEIENIIEQMLKRKINSIEDDLESTNHILNNYIEERILFYSNVGESLPAVSSNFDDLNVYFRKVISKYDN